ncbi:uncharacterized protein LY89DRAFT_723648 [Mollisia scopiformis]|uniref:Uncharacterized protein n=1 Tax=Mollisia scopiformis TaxID=149040 RepID=A0A132BDI4_MOLSC|nr:uncharacterized protein LY89DRAFT_723648 [Mollisia scopiformis]KUJ10441.1 hypothetical protein LY89DRAFT_723648 [Mollisia scopiformis]
MSSSNETIYRGFWTNYSKGEVGGLTLTLTTRNGGILIAVLAIFIQLIGVQSWGIVRFITHQLRATTQARSGLYHQQQAILRNDNSDTSTVWELTRTAYAWRSQSPKSFQNSIALVSIGILHLLAFGATSILASHITTTDSQVLVAQSPHCGPWEAEVNNPLSPVSMIADSYGFLTMQSSGKYVENCLAESASLPECDMFKRLELNWTSTTNQPCPFGDMCLGPANGSLYMDTGYVDSRDDLGINGKDEDRIQWRRNATCVPIKTDGFSTNGTSVVNYKDPHYYGRNNFNYTALFYGPMYGSPSEWGMDDPALQNATYIYTNFYDIKIHSFSSSVAPYQVETQIVDETQSSFIPMPALSVPNATLDLAFATYFSCYTEPSDDLWLGAHLNTTVSRLGSNETMEVYVQDKVVSVLACLEQQQICNPTPSPDNESNCTRFRPISHIFEDEELMAVLSNGRQFTMATAILDQVTGSNLDYAMNFVPLLAQSLVQSGISLPLAPNQWILEAENWFRVGLSNLQRLMADYITGPPPQYWQYIPLDQAKNDTDLNWMCGNQIMRRSDYINFRTLSIFLIFAFGIIIFVVNQTLETAVGSFRVRWKGGRLWRQRAWWADGTLQLQRRAFEGMGIGKWELDEWNRVPVTTEKKTFSALRNWDEMLSPVVGQKSTSSMEKQHSSTTKKINEVVQVVTNDSTTRTEETQMGRTNSGRPFSI